MTSNATSSTQPSASKEDEKLLRSLRSLTSFLGLGSLLSVLFGLYLIWSIFSYGFYSILIANTIVSFTIAGALFWCVRLLGQRNQIALRVYAGTIGVSWGYTLLVRLFFSHQPFSIIDGLSLVIPSLILFEMYRLIRKGILR